MSRSKQIGTAAESAVVRAIRTRGFAMAERRALHGAVDLGDITGTPGVAWEIKAGRMAHTASDALVDQWLAETDRERINAAADIGVLVLARAGIGPANAHRWWAILTWRDLRALGAPWAGTLDDRRPVRLQLDDVCQLLRRAGYGEPLIVDSAVTA